MYLVILNYDKKQDMCYCAFVDDNFTNIEALKMIKATELHKVSNIKHLNYTLDRQAILEQSSVSFDRFQDAKGVLLCVYRSRGTTLGYGMIALAGKNTRIVNVKVDELYKYEEESNGKFLQNAIWRNKTVNAYPLHNFPIVDMSLAKKKSVGEKKFKVPEIEKYVKRASLTNLVDTNESVDKNTIISRWLNADARVHKATKNTSEKLTRQRLIKIITPIVGKTPAVECADAIFGKEFKNIHVDGLKAVKKFNNSEYSKAQLKEINLAKHNGVEDTSIIENPKLTVPQMRTIWVAYKNKAKVNYFNKPECRGMNFYASRLFTDSDVEKYKEFLKHPEFTDDKLYMLEYAKRHGVYSDDMLSKNASVLSSDIELLEAQKEFEENENSNNVVQLDFSDLADSIFKEFSLIFP